MVTSPAYAKANVHRENAVDDHVILAATETYSKFPSDLTQRVNNLRRGKNAP
jgi:hypothetical protein